MLSIAENPSEFWLSNLDTYEVSVPTRKPSRLMTALDRMSVRVRDGITEKKTVFTQAVGELRDGFSLLGEDLYEGKEAVLDRIDQALPDLIQASKYATALAIPVMTAILSHEKLSAVADRPAGLGLFALSLMSAGIAIDQIRKPERDSLPKLRKQDPRW